MATPSIINNIKLRNSTFHSKALQLFKQLPNETDQISDYTKKLKEIINQSNFENLFENSNNTDPTHNNSSLENNQSEPVLQPESYSELLIFNEEKYANSDEQQQLINNTEQKNNLNETIDEFAAIKKIKTEYTVDDRYRIDFAPFGRWIVSPHDYVILDKIKFLKKSIGIEVRILVAKTKSFESLIIVSECQAK